MKYQLALAVMLFFTACNRSEQRTSVAVPEGMCALDLSKYGKNFSIFVPDTLKHPVSVRELPDGSLEVRSDKGFDVLVREDAADLSLLSEDLRADEVNKLRNTLRSDSTCMVWESAIVQPEFHFVSNKRVNGRTYSFSDAREPGSIFTQEQAERMCHAANNVVPKPHE